VYLNEHIISWNFDKSSYSPGDDVRINLWCENNGSRFLYLSEFVVDFEFISVALGEPVCGAIRPGCREFLGTVYFIMPFDVVGIKTFNFRYMLYVYDEVSKTWILFPNQRTDRFILSIYPKPYYNVFLSRGIRIEDRVVGDRIAQMIREWGFNTITVGIEVTVSDCQVAYEVRKEIQQNADATIVIATPRSLDLVSEAWKAAEWIHGETGISYGLDKLILILKDKNVSLEGLPSYLAKGNPQ
jgi:hypothetical protein